MAMKLGWAGYVCVEETTPTGVQICQREGEIDQQMLSVYVNEQRQDKCCMRTRNWLDESCHAEEDGG